MRLPPEVREDSVPVEHLQSGHRLPPQVRVKGHRDDGCLFCCEDYEFGPSQARHCQLTLDLCEVTVRRLQMVDWRLGQEDNEGMSETRGKH